MNPVLNAVADDRDHVAELDDVRFVAEPAMTRNHQRAAFLLRGRDRDLENATQRVEKTLNTAAALQVDHGIARSYEKIARADYVRAAEKDYAVAVAMGGLLMNDLYRLVVEKEFFGVGDESGRGPGRGGPWRSLSRGGAHTVQHVLVRENFS